MYSGTQSSEKDKLNSAPTSFTDSWSTWEQITGQSRLTLGKYGSVELFF